MPLVAREQGCAKGTRRCEPRWGEQIRGQLLMRIKAGKLPPEVDTKLSTLVPVTQLVTVSANMEVRWCQRERCCAGHAPFCGKCRHL